MPLYYHYTDEKGAEKIIRTGKILASLTVLSPGDTAYGNGVYLTQLNPETSTKTDIAMNNWLKTTPEFINRTKNYFTFNIPDSGVKDTGATNRNIFLFEQNSDLRLTKYPWWLKDTDTGRIIVSYKYQMTSLGPVAEVMRGNPWGKYVITEDAVNGRPVYFCAEAKLFLFINSLGQWMGGVKAGVDSGIFLQMSNLSLGPDPSLPWQYGPITGGAWRKDDDTLKAYAFQA